MEEPRPILYGVSDYAQIRKKNAWFVDRTAKIRDLEKIAYAVFLRPRRFGKSLLCAILECYYDIDCTDRFEELFSGTDIGARPTEEHNRHLVLSFNFSAVNKVPEDAERSFEVHVSDRIDAFARKYAKRLPDGLPGEILSRKAGGDKLSAQTFTQTYADACGIDQRLSAVNAGMRRFARTGKWDGILEPLLAVVKENFAIRDSKEGETAVASAVSAILISAGGPYVVTLEREANGGYYDLAITPRFDIAPQIAHAGLIELKYLKPGGRNPTKAALAAIKAEAIDQLDQYSADPALAAKCHLKCDAPSLKARSADFQPEGRFPAAAGGDLKPAGQFPAAAGGDLKPAGQFTAAAGGDLKPEGRFNAEGGTVSLHRLVLVFKGGDCLMAEEV